MKVIENMCLGDAEYEINGVKYIVSSRFANANICHLENTMTDKLKNYVGSDFADLLKSLRKKQTKI